MKKLDEILKNERIWGHEIMFPFHTAWVKLPECGKCSVIWSDCEDGMEHVSVSPKKQFRMPSWDDMCVLKDIFFEYEEEAYQIHPKNSQYVNDVENCLHLWKPKGHEIDELTKLEKKSRWIPVSERLPEDERAYLVTLKKTYGEPEVFCGIANYLKFGDAGYWNEKKYGYLEWDKYSDGCGGTKAYKVIAWMPLPEPWRGE